MSGGDRTTPRAIARLSRRAPPPRRGRDPVWRTRLRRLGRKVHGTSSGRRLTPSTQAVEPLSRRVMPGPSTGQARCGETVARSAGRLTLECESLPAPEDTRRVAVRARLGRGVGQPRRTLELDAHRGFWDFIHVWLEEDGGVVDFTIDYGVLD